jgi:hypothetical protein
MFAGWDGLCWKDRRQRRLDRWLSAPGIEYADETARAEYVDRVQLFIAALTLEKPRRVLVYPHMGFYPARYSGLTIREAMYDHKKCAAALVKFHEDFSPDFQCDLVQPGKVFELLELGFISWPGFGVSEQTPWQYREGEYMGANEYDALIADPSDYFRRIYLPRIGSAFACLSALDPFAEMMEAATLPFSILPFAHPGLSDGLQKLVEAAREASDYCESGRTVSVDAAGRLGIPQLVAGMAKAPYDVLADTLRGTKGIIMDRFRQPEKISEAAERLVPLQINWAVRQVAATHSPFVMLPLHKGADGFMSDADYRTFYWPTLKAVILGLVEEGVVPILFAEGGYNQRLDVISDDDIPSGSVLWLFDQTDMRAAKRALEGRACIAGNVPGALPAIGTPQDVQAYVEDLLNDVATEGGVVLMTGAVIDDAKPETIKAMIETGRKWDG